MLVKLPDDFRRCGGIETLHDVRLRCVCSEHADDGDHWLWRMATMHKGGKLPMCHVSGHPQRMAVRRVAWLLSGKPIKPRHLVWGTCDEPLCCNPTHTRSGTRKQCVQWMSRHGRLSTPKARRSKLAVARRNRKLSDEQVREILRDARPAVQIAAQYGTSRQVISAIKRRTMYADVVLGCDVFSLATSGMFPTLAANAARMAA